MSDRGEVTEEFLRRLLTVARKDRRENAALFEPWISQAEAKDDDAFYPALAHIIVEDIGVLRRFDQIMIDKKQPRKSFCVRACLNLSAPGERLDVEALLKLSADHFPYQSDKWIMLALLKRLW